MAYSSGTVVFGVGSGVGTGDLFKIRSATSSDPTGLINTYTAIDTTRRLVTIFGGDILVLTSHFSEYLELIGGMCPNLVHDWLTSIGIRKIIEILKKTDSIDGNMNIFMKENIGKSYIIPNTSEYAIRYEFDGKSYNFSITQEDIDTWSATLFDDLGDKEVKKEPDNNDGRTTCFWCGAKTKKVPSFMNTWDVCSKCNK